jgi:uncharacterized damage-inducible protein DinB
MTIQEIQKLFAYNSWATNRIFDALAALPEGQYLLDLKASHGGIHGTLTHLVAAEKIWLSRWVGKPESALLSTGEVPSLSVLKAAWEDVAARTARFLSRLDDNRLQQPFEYSSLSSGSQTSTYQQTLLHLVNHSTYHRGQITALMRQVGGQPVKTDLIDFYRLIAQPLRKQ